MRTRQMESGNHKRNVRRSTQLDEHPAFEWGPNAFIYWHKSGHKVRLRFDLVWRASCEALGISVEFTHRPPDDIVRLLDAWIEAIIEIDIDSFMLDMLDNLPLTTAPQSPGMVVGAEVGSG